MIFFSCCLKIHVEDKTVSLIFKTCQNLQKFSMTNVRNLTGECLLDAFRLTYLNMNFCSGVYEKFVIEAVKNNALTLQELHVKNYNHNLQSWYSPEFISQVSSRLFRLKMLSASLKAFDLVDRLEKLPYLESLSLNCMSRSGYVNLASLLNKSTTLTNLELESSQAGDALFTTFGINAPLVSLKLNYSSNLSDLTLYALIDSCSKTLRDLGMVEVNKISPESLTEFCQRMPFMEHIDLSFWADLNQSHLEKLIEIYENRQQQVTLVSVANDYDFNSLAGYLLMRQSDKTIPFYMERHSFIFYDIFYKNIKLQISVDKE